VPFDLSTRLTTAGVAGDFAVSNDSDERDLSVA
jgi:hypothetical protein